MLYANLKWIGLAALVIAAAASVVVAGVMTSPQSQEQTTVSQLAHEAPIDVRGASDVRAFEEGHGFAEAFASYIDAADGEVVTVVAKPSNKKGDSFYANAGGLWYECERIGGASGWAFALLGEESPVKEKDAGTHSPAQGASRTADFSDSAAGEAKASQQETLPAGWVSLTDLKALTATLGREIALTLPAAVVGYCDMAGITFDASSAKVNVSAVRIDQEGTAFTVDVGNAILDVLYSDGSFGFLVI